MTAVPSLPTSIAAAGGKLTATNWNAMVSYLTFQRNPPRFKGSITSATALTTLTAIKFPSIIDTASGWNVSTGQYTVQYPGTYRVSAQLKWGAVTPGATAMYLVKNGTATLVSVNPPNANFGGPVINSEVQVVAGDVLEVQLNGAFTTNVETGDNNFLVLTWTGA